MSFVLTRMFAYFTLVMYLAVGAVAVRTLAPEMTTVSLSSDYLKLFSKTEIKVAEIESLTAPEMKFAKIKFPIKEYAVKRVTKVAPEKTILPKMNKVAESRLEVVTVEKNELPFAESVKLVPVVMHTELPGNLVALYKDFTFTETQMLAEALPAQDEVSTKLAAAQKMEEDKTIDQEADLAFFEYDKVEEAPAVPQEEKTEALTAAHASEEVAIDDLMAFDYSKANSDIKSQTTTPTIATTPAPGVTTQEVATPVQQPNISIVAASKAKAPSSVPVPGANPYKAIPEKSLAPAKKVTTHPSRVTIQIVGTDLKTSNPESGFEVRFLDDLSEAIGDYNVGRVNLDQELATKSMTRATTVLKRGFIPTTTDLIFEEGVVEVSVPLIEEQTFNELILPFESRGPIGAVLVELDDEVEGAILDVPYSKVLRLDSNLKVTHENDFAYELFVGVKAGNALLSYKGQNGDVTSKIIHVHEREVTFESNFFENVTDEKVRLFEKDLLGREKAPLIISSEDVKQFATPYTGKKLNNHTYKMNFKRTLLGARRYLELTHQKEPIFVGLRKNINIEVPSENFMRYVLSQFEGSKLGNRCLVQVNLTKKAAKVDVGSEALDAALATYTQILDKDGKFYDSVSDKSEKVIVVGEHQGAPEHGQDGKINIKITYQDGSVDYLGSYCSPNTYLVEQL